MIPPFLKWPGGKRWLVESGQLPIPRTYRRYVEPFVGGGAVFFHLQPRESILSDLNEDLICLYKVMKGRPKQLFYRMVFHHIKHTEKHYYKIRSQRPKSQIERSTRLLYLNRTCWNGLYRVNLKGEFNVPIVTKTNVVIKTDDFVRLSKVLRNADIGCGNFGQTIGRSKKGDFLFVDPPYTVKHNYNNFKKYNEKIFSWDDQIRLCESVKNAKERGVKFVVTNADHPSVHSLYSGIAKYRQISQFSSLAGDAFSRGKVTEALYYGNFELDERESIPTTGLSRNLDKDRVIRYLSSGNF